MNDDETPGVGENLTGMLDAFVAAFKGLLAALLSVLHLGSGLVHGIVSWIHTTIGSIKDSI